MKCEGEPVWTENSRDSRPSAEVLITSSRAVERYYFSPSGEAKIVQFADILRAAPQGFNVSVHAPGYKGWSAHYDSDFSNYMRVGEEKLVRMDSILLRPENSPETLNSYVWFSKHRTNYREVNPSNSLGIASSLSTVINL